MPYEVRWHLPKRVIMQHYHGVLSVTDLREANRLVGDYVRSGTPLVHSIAVLKDVEKFPTNLFVVSRAIEPIDNTLLGWTIVITNNSLIRFLCSAVSQIFGSRFRSAQTLDEALAFLKTVDETLPESV